MSTYFLVTVVLASISTVFALLRLSRSIEAVAREVGRLGSRAAPLTWNKQLEDYFKARKNEEGEMLCKAINKIIRRRSR